MSRPGSHLGNGGDDPFDSNGFSLPLFNPHPPAVPSINTRPQQVDSGALPPPAASSHTQRHSVAYTSNYSDTLLNSPPTNHRQRQSMATALPYGHTGYPQTTTAPYSTDELMPPSASTSFGSLARSASLGARKKDPYAYSSDDVESGLGQMDMRGEPSGTGWGGFSGTRHTSYAPPPTTREVAMSPSGPRTYSSGSMNPPPIPAHALGRPSPGRVDSNGTSPARSTLGSSPATNPYVPRNSDAGPSGNAQHQWMEYQRPSGAQRVGSHHSPASDQQSPYIAPDMATPYDMSPGSAPLDLTRWSSSQAPPSPPRHIPSQQLYPASQPTTPAGKYETGSRNLPNRGRGASSRTGFRDVNGRGDLKPIINDHPSGRRADPNSLGRYLSPLKCLTIALPQTYALCNHAFRYESSDNPRRVLTKPSKPVHNNGVDNEDWDYILYVNDVLGGEHGGDRYLILDVLGQGTFGQVVKCQNMRTHDICAVKVVKNKPAYHNQSKMEVAILDLLNQQYDPNDSHHILRMLESFTHKSHLCLVFECLSSNLYELIKQNQFKGLSTQLVKVFTQQLLDCLTVLKEARLIHCDLKPENILLKSLQSPQIKVIDFGSACHEMQTVYTYVQSRFYRCPEVLLGLHYNTAIDMWSLGCIVVELFLGLPLFPGTSEYNQISRIVDMLGNPPSHILENGKQTHEFFNYNGLDAHGRKQYRLKPMEQYASEHRTNEQPSKQYFKQTKLKDIIMEYPFSKKNPKQSDIDKEMANRRAFVDFVEGLINMDPLQRWTPAQAAKHPYITGEKFTGHFEPPAGPVSRHNSAQPPSESPTTPSSSKKYGGLVQSPPSSRGQRIYSDAAAYNHQLAQHQSYTAQVQNQQAIRHQPFSPQYEGAGYNSQQQHQRTPSSAHAAQSGRPQQWQTMGPPPQIHPGRVPSQGMSASTSHAALRPNAPPMTAAATNPPPNSYYPSSRNRANTINQMDGIPPALARLTHMGAPDPSGTRNLTPVLNRDDAIREWERRQAGHSKTSSLHNSSYPQLEYLQEQAELAAMNQQWMMPGQYAGPSHGHRSHPSNSGHNYHMQPGIGASPQHAAVPVDYRAGRSEYEAPPPSATSASRAYLPAYPPPAAANPNSATFDGFDSRDLTMGSMYTPLQPTPPFPTYAAGQGHQARASYSGPYTTGNNPFAGQPPSQNQSLASPRYQRRSQQYGA